MWELEVYVTGLYNRKLIWLSYMSLWWSSVCQPSYTVTSQLTLKHPDMFAYMYYNGPI